MACAITRRKALALLSATAAGAGTGLAQPALAQWVGKGSSTLREQDWRLLHAIENLPWVASPGPDSKPVYILWSPWCTFCSQLMRDHAAGRVNGVQLRWIGSGGRDRRQRTLVASVARAQDFNVLKSALLHERTSPAVELPEAYVQRVATTELLFVALEEYKGFDRAYPCFVHFDGKRVVVNAGYERPRDLAAMANAQPLEDGARATPAKYLDDAWADDGAAPARPYEGRGDYVIYSLPTEQAIPVKTVGKGHVWPGHMKRYWVVNGERWVSVDLRLPIARHDGYVRVA
jgi:hypothetical protein